MEIVGECYGNEEGRMTPRTPPNNKRCRRGGKGLSDWEPPGESVEGRLKDMTEKEKGGEGWCRQPTYSSEHQRISAAKVPAQLRSLRRSS